MTCRNLNHPDLYILRHGETVWNRSGLFQGRKDSPLTDLGKRQALTQRKILQSIHNPPTKIFSSPQGRALSTARLVFGSDADIRTDNRLQEIDFGSWEGLRREDIKGEVDVPFEGELWNFKSPGGESFESIDLRVKQFLDELADPAVIVTHGTTSLVLRGLCMGLDQAALLRLSKDQGCVYLLSSGEQSILRWSATC